MTLKHILRRWLTVAALLCAGTLAMPQTAHAISYLTYLGDVAGARLATFPGFQVTPKQERDDIRMQYNLYLFEQKQNNNKQVGQAFFNGDAPATIVAEGTPGTLTFQYVDTTAGAPQGVAGVAAVSYYVNTDPSNPSNFTFIGTSTDSGGNFDLSYTMPTGNVEPTIEAIPYSDSSATMPIVIYGVDGDNVAYGLVTLLNPNITPEPSTLTLLLTGVLGVVGYRWRRKRIVSSC